MFSLLYAAIAVYTSQWLAPLDCQVRVAAIVGDRATLAIPACQGEPAYHTFESVSELPACARIVGAWLACESIGEVAPDPAPCYPYVDGHGVWCPYGKDAAPDPRPTAIVDWMNAHANDSDREPKACPGDWLGHMDRPAKVSK